jgi:hypothetical protein
MARPFAFAPRTGQGAVMSYFADVGPQTGPILWKHGHGAIGVLGSRDDHTPIGMALGCG